MYQALYRKYRPKTFDDVVGQDVVIQTLKNAISNEKISHAYLLSGPRGCGKTSIAKIFARLVNCEHPEGTNPCNKCVFCTQKDEQNLDIIEMDAASNNGVDEIREINTKVNLVPSVGKYKVYIIDEVHMLTIGAFNALLKTLEEPPAHVIFILATTDPNKVPITILSRCQRFDLKKISEDVIFERISNICNKEGIKVTDEALREIARLGDGSMRDTLSVLDQVISYAQDEISLDTVHDVNGTVSQKDISLLIEKIVSKNVVDVLNSIKEYDQKGKSIIRITEEIILYLRNLILYKVSKEKGNPLYDNIELTTEEVITYIRVLNEAILDMKKFTNYRMMLELAVINIMSIGENKLGNFKTEEDNKLDFPGNNLNEKTVEVAEQQVLENKKPDVSKVVTPKTAVKRIVNTENDLSKLNQFTDTRVSNTLAKFSKKDTTELKKQLTNLNNYLMDDKLGNTASLILDGELKAVGENYAIFTYKTSNLVNLFINNIKNIEELLKELLNTDLNVVAVDSNKWDEIKEKFNSKTVNYEYVPEKISIDEVLKSIKSDDDSTDMQSLFGDIVEYE